MERILRDILQVVRDDGVKLERLTALHDLLKERIGVNGEDNVATKELLRKMEEKEQEEKIQRR